MKKNKVFNEPLESVFNATDTIIYLHMEDYLNLIARDIDMAVTEGECFDIFSAISYLLTEIKGNLEIIETMDSSQSGKYPKMYDLKYNAQCYGILHYYSNLNASKLIKLQKQNYNNKGNK